MLKTEKSLEFINWWRNEAIKAEKKYNELLELVKKLVEADKIPEEDSIELINFLLQQVKE